jgi:hypothetical protein
MSALLHGDTFFLDNFAVRQWDDPNYSGTRIQFDKAEFVEKVGSSSSSGTGVAGLHQLQKSGAHLCM